LLGKLLLEIKHTDIHQVVLHATPIGKSLYEKYGFKEKTKDKEMVLTV
jgi:predicted acetyltransferase